MQETISKNTHVRGAILKQLIEDIEGTNTFPVTLHSFFYQFMHSSSTALKEIDPENNYSRLLLGLISPTKFPDLVEQIGEIPPDKVLRGFLKLPPHEVTTENLASIEYRNMTLNRVFKLAFNSFYLASTGLKMLSETSPPYKIFARQVEAMREQDRDLPSH